MRGLFCVLIVSFAVTIGNAQAANCGPLQQINTVDLVQNKVRAMVPVSINGSQRLLLLDTGASVSHISAAVAHDLNLPLVDSQIKMLDLYGNASTKMAHIDQFVLGRQSGSVYLMIEPDPNFGKGRPYVGLFAPDLMAHYDVELDFSNSKMNFFSPDHCEGHVVYWHPQLLPHFR